MGNQILIKVKGYEKVYNCTLIKSKYFHNNSLALSFIDTDDNSCYGTFTKCLENCEPMDSYCAFVDTNNWLDIDLIIKNYNLGEPTGRVCRSGYCLYPEYRFNKMLIDMIPEEY